MASGQKRPRPKTHGASQTAETSQLTGLVVLSGICDDVPCQTQSHGACVLRSNSSRLCASGIVPVLEQGPATAFSRQPRVLTASLPAGAPVVQQHTPQWVVQPYSARSAQRNRVRSVTLGVLRNKSRASRRAISRRTNIPSSIRSPPTISILSLFSPYPSPKHNIT